MKVTQNKKGTFSLTQLEKSDLVTLHNTLTDYALKSEMRIALLKSLPGEERVKYQSEQDIEKFFESQGLILRSDAKASQDLKSVSNGSTATPLNLDDEANLLDEDSEELNEEEDDFAEV